MAWLGWMTECFLLFSSSCWVSGPFFILCQNCKTGEESSCGDKERAAVLFPKEKQRLPPNARAVAEWPLVAYLNSTSSS